MNQLDLENLGERLKESIKEAKTNQKELAEKTGLSTTSINNYTSGKRVPDADSFYKMCAYLNTRMEWILTGKGPRHINDELCLSTDEKEVLDVYNKLTYEEKMIIKGKLYEFMTIKK